MQPIKSKLLFFELTKKYIQQTDVVLIYTPLNFPCSPVTLPYHSYYCHPLNFCDYYHFNPTVLLNFFVFILLIVSIGLIPFGQTSTHAPNERQPNTPSCSV